MEDLKDSVVGLYVRQYIMPRALIFDTPGFVDFRISGKTPIFARQILMPESFFINIESKLIEKYGDEAKKQIYSAGKKFGYSFAQLGHFENIKEHPGDELKKWVTIASKFVEGTYATQIINETDVNNKVVEYNLTNFAVANKIGYDYFFIPAGAAGIIAWLFQDFDIEGVLFNSRYDDGVHLCNVTCAPKNFLQKKHNEVFSETNLGNLEQNAFQYQSFNKETPIKYQKSLQTYLNAKIFKYKDGIMSYKNERFFLLEVSGMYLFEKEFINENIKNLIKECAKNVGADIFGNFSKNLGEIVEFLSALGWGEVTISGGKKVKVIIDYFPWTKYYKDIDFLIIRGFLEGILQSVFKKEYSSEKPTIDINRGRLILLIECNER